MTWAKRCGEMLRQARKAKGLTMGDLARKADVSVSTMSAWERGKSTPTNMEVTLLAVALDVTGHYLRCQVDEPDGYPKPDVGPKQHGIDLAWIFTYHPPDEGDVEKYNALRDAAHQFAQVVIENTPPGADQSAAIRKIREAVMTANAALALKGRLTTCD